MMNRKTNEAEWLKNRLIEQLTFWDEQRIAFLDTYFPGNNAKQHERTRMEQFIKRYMLQLEHTVAMLTGSDGQDIKRRAWIGSKVQIRDKNAAETETFKLCFPDDSDPDTGAISFLSPIGRELTLAQEGDELVLHTPAGEWPVIVSKIEYDAG